jgi:hypothetical protein
MRPAAVPGLRYSQAQVRHDDDPPFELRSEDPLGNEFPRGSERSDDSPQLYFADVGRWRSDGSCWNVAR